MWGNLMIALEILVKGMAGIFVALAVIAIVVYLMQKIDHGQKD